MRIGEWKKNFWSYKWTNSVGTTLTIMKHHHTYYVVIRFKGADKSYPFKTKKEAYNFAVHYMKTTTHLSHIFAKNIIISLDFDGVIAHGVKAKIKYAKKWFGVDLNLEQTKKEGFENLMRQLGRTDINYRSLMDRLNREHIMEYELHPNCKEVIHDLYKQGFRIVIVTSRNDHDYPYAKKFIKHHFGSVIKYIHNTRNEPKGYYLSRLKPRLHMDDDIKKLQEIRHLPLHPLFYRQPENQHVQNDGFRQIRSWGEFHTFCIELMEEHEGIALQHGIPNDWTNVAKLMAREYDPLQTEYGEFITYDEKKIFDRR